MFSNYNKERINLEVYHALSDAGGALHFFKLLIANYIMRKHTECSFKLGEFNESTSEDSFKTYYSGASIKDALSEKKSAKQAQTWNKKGYIIQGEKAKNGKIKVMVGSADTDTVKATARKYKVSVTSLLCAVLMIAIESIKTKENHNPIVVSIPVNLRKYFPSNSARNFFQVVNMGYAFGSGDDELSDVVSQIKEQLDRLLTPEVLTTQLNTLCALEHNKMLQLIPRLGKDAVIRLVSVLGQAQTTSISNLGKIVMPCAFNPYIKLFDFITSTSSMQLNVCSYEPFMMMNLSYRYSRKLF